MQDFTIKELGELINSINKTPDARNRLTYSITGVGQHYYFVDVPNGSKPCGRGHMVQTTGLDV